MQTLETITANTQRVVEKQKSTIPVKKLESSIFFNAPTVSLVNYLKRKDLSGIIAEFKKKSPSAGDIAPYAQVEDVTIGYMQAGACALSILTDEKFFGGSLKDLERARLANYCPILRKDFIIDEYQVVEARSSGADVILLIAALHTPSSLTSLCALAKTLQLQVILEVHNKEELEVALNTDAEVIGINNRNLKTMETSLETTAQLYPLIPKDRLVISESGIKDADSIRELKNLGVDGFLIGESLMRHTSPASALKKIITSLSDVTI